MSNSIDHDTAHLARTITDTARSAGADAQRKIGKAASRATAQVSRVYGDVSDRAHRIAETVDPYVKGKPYATIALVAIVGLVLGLALAGRGPKVIYVEPRR